MTTFFDLQIFNAAEVYLSLLGSAFPEFHLGHLLSACLLEFLTGERRSLLQAELLTVGHGIQSVKGKMFLGENLHCLATDEAGNALLLDRLLGIHRRGIGDRSVFCHALTFG